jgi:hypothetical protein
MKIRDMMIAAMAMTGAAVAQQASPSPSPQTPAPAEQWVYAGMKGGAMGWEVTSMGRDAATSGAYAARFLYYATPQTQKTTTYSVILQKFEFQCLNKRFLLGDGLYFNDQLEQVGAAPPETAWAEVVDNSPEWILMQVACFGATIGNQKTASSLVDALTDAKTLAIP